jgi:hypothetical protein
MAGVSYDLQGRLLGFYAVPPQVEEKTGPSPPPDWSLLFAEAGLDTAQLEPVLPQRTPPFYCDRREAWAGHWPARPDIPIRVELASYRGRPVWFEVVEPWRRADRMEPWTPGPSQQVAKYLAAALCLLLIGVGAVLARRNLTLGRGDWRGAFRLGATLVAIGLTMWVLDAHHVADIGGEMGLLARGAGMVALLVTLVCLSYLALEPYVRRLRPTTLVSWTRLLGGGLSDTVVGRDVLLGATWGALVALGLVAAAWLPVWLGRPGFDPFGEHLHGLLGFRESVAGSLGLIQGDILISLGSLLFYLVLRFLLRRDGPALVALVVVLAGLRVALDPEPLWLMAPVWLVFMGLYVFLLFRFGLLAAIAGLFVLDSLLAVPLTTNLGAWYAGPTIFAVTLVAAIGLLAFRASRGGSGLRRYLAGEVPTRP